MRFRNDKIGLSVEIEDGLIEKIRSKAAEHYPMEFGGILVGRYVDDNTCVHISEMILPSSFKSSRYTFERGTEGIKDSLEQFFCMEIPLIYVGEWHTHPDAAPVPSMTDILAMKQIVAAETVNIDSPIMLIVGITPETMKLAMYVYYNKKIYDYENE